MTDRLQLNLMFDVAAFGILRAKKFPARRQVVKKRAHFDLGARRFTAFPHNVDFAAIDENFCTRERARFTRCHTESRHTCDARQRLAAKPQRRNSLKVGSRTNLAGSMPLQRKQRVIAAHAKAVLDHANQRNSTATNDAVDVASACVETGYHQFLYD